MSAPGPNPAASKAPRGLSFLAETLLVISVLLPHAQLPLNESYRVSYCVSATMLAGAALLSLRSYRSRTSLFDLGVGTAALGGLALHLANIVGGRGPW